MVESENTTGTDTGIDTSTQTICKTPRQIWWNRMRVRLPAFLLLIVIVSVNPKWGHSIWYLFGIPLMLLGVGLRAWAVGYINKDRELATGGPYALCRHPLYLGTFIASIGLCVLIWKWLPAAFLAVLFPLVYIPTIRQEEGYLTKVYGDAYREYATRVPAFLPRPWRHGSFGTQAWSFQRLIKNGEHKTWVALLVVILAKILIKYCLH
jgi:protein-S-isoprenylcysteine O-methyltransferase Ste14